ncbi:MAG: tRNA lysidine(34) synthetase TilS [Zetaproteobacteria bacterium]|nr:MAG: tRNA lysidine(34) synthetase TilS [Zetaproteobacteria bacterium]
MAAHHAPRLPQARRWLEQAGATLDPHLPIAVALSGGADSTALLLALAERHPRIEAWHVDHGWHADSAAQAAWLARRCRRWGIPLRTVRLCSLPPTNREAAARQARYAAFAGMAAQSGIDRLALAHQRDDQAETVCLRLLQGAGVRGCTAMRPVRRRDGLILLRPLLAQPAAELRRALRARAIDWLEDPSNHDLTLRRNRIRHRLFPAIDRATEPGYATALFLRWQRQAARLQRAIERQAEAIPLRREPDGASVSWRQWRAAARPIRAAVLQRLAQAVCGAGVCLGRRHIRQIEAWRAEGGRGGLDLSRSRLIHAGDRLILRLKGGMEATR